MRTVPCGRRRIKRRLTANEKGPVAGAFCKIGKDQCAGVPSGMRDQTFFFV